MSTVSEQYFLDYCRARRYKVKRITPKDKAGRFPDYETTTPTGSVIVEIKEFTPNDEDKAFAATLEKAAAAIKPELVLVSAGFDAHARDPIGSLGLETEDFTTLTRQVLDVAVRGLVERGRYDFHVRPLHVLLHVGYFLGSFID